MSIYGGVALTGGVVDTLGPDGHRYVVVPAQKGCPQRPVVFGQERTLFGKNDLYVK